MLGEAIDSGIHSAIRAGDISVSRVSGTSDDVDTTRKLRSDVTSDGLVDKRLSIRCVHRAVESVGVSIDSGKRRASRDGAVWVESTTLLNGITEYVNVPSVEEITVESIASSVAKSKDEATTVAGVNVVDVVVHLVEEVHEELGVSRRTGTVVNLA